MSAQCNYTNTTISGNSVVVSVLFDGRELYRSETLAPGEGVSAFELSEALAAGEYEAELLTTVYNADGSVQLTSRVPVTITFEG